MTIRRSKGARHLICLVVCAVTALAVAAGFPARAAAQAGCTVSESTLAADPGVTVVGTAYVLVTTSRPAAGLPITRSSDGINWCPTGAQVLTGPVKWNPGPALWAPKLYGVSAGRLIAVYSGVQPGTKNRRCIGLAVSSAGFTSVYKNLPRFCRTGKRFIDPALVRAGAKTYLLYKEDPKPKRSSRRVKRLMIRSIDFGPNLNRANLGEPHEILRPRGWEGSSVEAPTVIPRGGKYYLFYSGGNYATRGYGIGVAVADTLGGRFRRLSGNPIIGGKRTPGQLCGIGHQDVTNKPGDGWRIYYHFARMNGTVCDTDNRRLTYQRLEWTPNGEPKLATPAAGASATGESACVKHPGEASVVCVRNAGHVVDVCDRDADGHRVYARVITDASSPTFFSPFYDDNDSKPGCANIPFTSRVASFAVCTQTEGCSAFTSTGGQPPPPAPTPAPPPPPAKDICVAHPSDPSVVCTRNAGHTVDVCDRHADGHRAYARVITQASYPTSQSPYYDTNDSQPGCANIAFPSRVLSVAVCVQYEGCSAFKPT